MQEVEKVEIDEMVVVQVVISLLDANDETVQIDDKWLLHIAKCLKKVVLM